MSTLSLADGQLMKFYVTGVCVGMNDELDYYGIVIEVPYRHRFPCNEDVVDFHVKITEEFTICHGHKPKQTTVLDWKRLLDD